MQIPRRSTFQLHFLIIHSLALPGATLAMPVTLIISKGRTHKQTNTHMPNYIIDYIMNSHVIQCCFVDIVTIVRSSTSLRDGIELAILFKHN